VPKTIYFVELLLAELLSPPSNFDIQFTELSKEVARYFSHSKPDELLADLFSKRSLPAAEFNAGADQFGWLLIWGVKTCWPRTSRIKVPEVL
jgi:hypothetical protein